MILCEVNLSLPYRLRNVSNEGEETDSEDLGMS